MIRIKLKGDVIKEFESGVTPYEVALSIGAGLARAVCAANIDGKNVDKDSNLIFVFQRTAVVGCKPPKTFPV